jgi:hypothetical protein
MDLTTGDVLIISGEGEGSGAVERYYGKRDEAAIRRKLSRERASGDRWADAWIELDGLEDVGYPGERVYGKLGRDLDEIVDRRAVLASMIQNNPAAILRAGKANPASAANGARGGRPIIREWTGEGGEALKIKIDPDGSAESWCNGTSTGRYHLHADEVSTIKTARADEAFAIPEQIKHNSD